MERLIIYIISLLFSISQSASSLNLSVSGDTCNILFLGNSYSLYNHLPSLVRNLANYSGKVVHIDDYMVENTGLSDWAQSIDVEVLINDQEWDYAVLQGSGAGTAYPEYYSHARVFESLEILKEKISSKYDSTKIIFTMPWAFEDGMTWLAGWTDDYEDMQLKIYDNTLKYCNELNLIIAPVGWAWYRVLEEQAYPLHYLHMEDYNHPSPRGSYLMACVIYSVIFLESPAGITYFAFLPANEARYFQSVAKEVVFRSPTTWNLPDIQLGTGEMRSTGLHLNQNYPNPCETTTRINFETETAGFIELSLFNEYGYKCYEMINEYMLPGKYSVIFELTCLPDGIYFYSLITENQIVTKTMMLVH